MRSTPGHSYEQHLTVLHFKRGKLVKFKRSILFDQGLYYKALRIHNLRKMYRFSREMMSFSIVSQFRRLGQTHSITMESVRYEQSDQKFKKNAQFSEM